MATIYDDGREYDALGMGHAPEVGFYTSLVRAGGSALELACGTGRLAVPLAQAGLGVVGVDIAPAMLEAARAKAARAGVRVDFVEADVRRFALGRRFDLVFFPNNSLAHLHTLADVRACLVCVGRHLAPGGRFALDTFNPSLALLTRSPGEHFPVAEFEADGGGRVTVTETVEYDPATQVSHARWHYRRAGRPDSVRPLDLRMFFPQELDALLVLNGFEIEAKYGDHAGTSFTGASRQQVLVCRQSQAGAAPSVGGG